MRSRPAYIQTVFLPRGNILFVSMSESTENLLRSISLRDVQHEGTVHTRGSKEQQQQQRRHYRNTL